MKIAPEDRVVCGLCHKVIHVDNSKLFVSSYEWGSLTGSANYKSCCKGHKLNSSKEPTGKYVRQYA